MSKEQAMAQIQAMTIEDILAKGLYVVVEEVNKALIMIDVFFFKEEAKEALRQLKKFDSEHSKTKLLSPKNA
jgi:RecB family endonuclease NucS